MRKVAGYILEHADNTDRPWPGDEVVLDWLGKKGIIDPKQDTHFSTRDGLEGRYLREQYQSDNGDLIRHVLTEPAGQRSELTTTINQFTTPERTGIYVGMQVGMLGPLLAPDQVECHTPYLIRCLAELNVFGLNGIPIVRRPYEFPFDNDGFKLHNIMVHTDRSIPLVCVSEDEDGPLTDGLADDLADALCGHAIVARVGRNASWRLTDIVGKEWSVFNGAVRVYWPRMAEDDNPYHHMLWMKPRLLDSAPTPRAAAVKLKNGLRRQFMQLSATTIHQPDVIGDIIDRATNAAFIAERRALVEQADYEQVATSYANENDQLRKRNKGLSDENDDLKAQIEQMRIAFAAHPARYSGEDDLPAPDLDVPATTTREAVDLAKECDSDVLFFGSDVEEGLRSLQEDNSTPGKVQWSLQSLAAMTRQRNSDEGLGCNPIDWLSSRGINCSIESETCRNSATRRANRTWHGIDGRMMFEKHIKLYENTSANAALRLYFEYEPVAKKTVVAWIGPHPD